MVPLILLTICISLVILISQPYFPNVVEDQGFWFSPLLHVVITLALSLISALLYGLFPSMRQHWRERLAHFQRELYWDIFFFFLFIPAIASVPFALSLNRNLDFSKPEVKIVSVVEHNFKRRGVLETRRCHIKGTTQNGESLKIKYRPINGECVHNQVGAQIKILRWPGLFNKPWIQFSTISPKETALTFPQRQAL